MGKLKFQEVYGPGNLRSVRISEATPPTYTNLLGEVVVVGPKKKVNPMLVCGKGPADRRCKHCAHFVIKDFHNKTYFKCEFRGNSNGPGTDHRANWPTCAKFKLDID